MSGFRITLPNSTMRKIELLSMDQTYNNLLLPIINRRIDSIDFIGSQNTISNSIRRDAYYYGGVGGSDQWVNAALKVISTAQPQTGQNEWALVGSLNNQSNDPNVENVGGYLQVNKMGNSKSWGATIEAIEDKDSYTTSLVGCELDLFGNGGNKNLSSKVGLDIIIGKNNPSGPAIQPYAGIAIRNNGNNSVNGGSAILIDPNEGTSGNTWDNAIKVYPDAKISFDNGTYITYNSSAQKFQFYIGGVLKQSIPP